MISGPQGVGKTTILQQLVLGVVGLRDEVLGIPIKPVDDRPVLYLALDRPEQIARSGIWLGLTPTEQENQMPATKTTAPASAKKRAAKPATKKPAAKAPRDRSRWNDASGQEIIKGVTVKVNGTPVGTAAYFHTHEINGETVVMVGGAHRQGRRAEDRRAHGQEPQLPRRPSSSSSAQPNSNAQPSEWALVVSFMRPTTGQAGRNGGMIRARRGACGGLSLREQRG
jgi:hypothetical protein